MIYEWKKKAETELVKASTYCVEQYGRNIAKNLLMLSTSKLKG